MSTREKLIVANWKMNFTIQDALKFFAALQRELKGTAKAEVVICPPFTTLYALDEAFSETPYKLGAQNLHWEESGAFTGEISAHFLKELRVIYVIVGHSERRRFFQETEAIINKKVGAAIQQAIIPIVCVGESEEEHNAGKTIDVVEGQIKRILDGQMKSELNEMVWAYEPIWAIGTGKNATPKQAQEVMLAMRRLLGRILDAPTADSMRILYGGSVSDQNAGSFLKEEDCDGLLVGGAGLDPKKFASIIGAAEMQ